MNPTTKNPIYGIKPIKPDIIMNMNDTITNSR